MKRPGGRIRIAISDTGAGLSADQQAQLFQSFNRLGQETGGEEGTGIGLVVSRRLVELMHGDIGVESTVDVGSTFWIELARADALDEKDVTAGPDEHLAPRPLHGELLRTLLYVEDNPANLKLIEHLIARRADMRLLSAGDAKRGIEIARAEHPDVILMDINLPGISGIEALRILRLDPLTSHIPVVALSANAMPRDVARGLDSGFFRYLTKPVRIPEFNATLTEALDVAAEPPQAPLETGSPP